VIFSDLQNFVGISLEAVLFRRNFHGILQGLQEIPNTCRMAVYFAEVSRIIVSSSVSEPSLRQVVQRFLLPFLKGEGYRIVHRAFPAAQQAACTAWQDAAQPDGHDPGVSTFLQRSMSDKTVSFRLFANPPR
jgi:hypothetical protein